MGELQIEKRIFGDIAILDCSGRIVVQREALFFFDAAAFAAELSGNILVNLEGVTAVDGGGLGVLVLLHRLANSINCGLRFCTAKKSVREVLARTHLHTVFAIHNSEDDALEAFFRTPRAPASQADVRTAPGYYVM